MHALVSRNKGPTAESDFIRVAAAYELLTDSDRRAAYDASATGWRAGDAKPTDFAKTFDLRKFYEAFDAELDLHFEAVKKARDAQSPLYNGDAFKDLSDDVLDQHVKAHKEAVAKMRREMEKLHGMPGSSIDVTALFEDFPDPKVGREKDNL